jgi:hypothetical protein
MTNDKKKNGLDAFLGSPAKPDLALRQNQINAFNLAVNSIVQEVQNGANEQMAIRNKLNDKTFRDAVGSLATQLSQRVYDKLNANN